MLSDADLKNLLALREALAAADAALAGKCRDDCPENDEHDALHDARREAYGALYARSYELAADMATEILRLRGELLAEFLTPETVLRDLANGAIRKRDALARENDALRATVERLREADTSHTEREGVLRQERDEAVSDSERRLIRAGELINENDALRAEVAALSVLGRPLLTDAEARLVKATDDLVDLAAERDALRAVIAEIRPLANEDGAERDLTPDEALGRIRALVRAVDEGAVDVVPRQALTDAVNEAERLRAALVGCVEWMKHGDVFIRSRQIMHMHGRVGYAEALDVGIAALGGSDGR